MVVESSWVLLYGLKLLTQIFKNLHEIPKNPVHSGRMLLVTILVIILKMYVVEITKFLVNYFVIRSYIILNLCHL